MSKKVELSKKHFEHLKNQPEEVEGLGRELFKDKAEVYRQQIIERNARKALEREFR